MSQRELERQMKEDVCRLGINVDLDQRWEDGVPHHPEAEQMARELAAVDRLYAGGCLDLGFGGDGDLGEVMIYLLDIVLELRDARSVQNSQDQV